MNNDTTAHSENTKPKQKNTALEKRESCSVSSSRKLSVKFDTEEQAEKVSELSENYESIE